MANIARRSRNWFGNEDRESNARQLMQNRAPGMLPFGPISSFFLDMDRFFDNTLRNFGVPALANMNMQMMFNPKLDITSNENEYTITCEVPGLEEKDIKLDVSNNGLLTISGEKRQESNDSRKDVHCTECSYGSFERSLSLPEDVDAQSIEANFKNGVLTITCPRNESAKQSRRQIKISSDNRGASNTNERSASNERSSSEQRSAQGQQAHRKAS